MNDSFYDSAARELQNFRPEVINLWFAHVESAGWPPTFDANGFATGVWRTRVFRDRPITFWRSVSWSLEPYPLTLMSLEPESRDVVHQLAIAFAAGLPHPLDIPIADASDRIRRFVTILQQTGRLPVPPVLLAVKDGSEVLDGNHRLAALFAARVAGLPVAPWHDVWIARSSVT